MDLDKLGSLIVESIVAGVLASSVLIFILYLMGVY